MPSSPNKAPLSPAPSQHEAIPLDTPADPAPVTAAPPQPPLRGTDVEAPPLPQIVHGIDPDEPASQPNSEARVPFLSQTGIGDVVHSLTERVQRVVRMGAHTLGHTDVDASSGARNQSQGYARVPTFFLFGDSITELSVSTTEGAPGWGTLLRDDYLASADVIVRGHSGYNTRWALHLLPRQLRSIFAGVGTRQTHIKLVTVFFGANDACEKESRHHVPLGEYAANLVTMITFIRSYDITPLLIAPPPVTPAADMFDGGRCLERAGKYAETCVSVAKSLNCAVLDVYSEFLRHAQQPDGDLEKLFSDGLHFSAEGNRLMHDLVRKKIAEIIPNDTPDRLPKFAPSFEDIDVQNLSDSLGESELIQSSMAGKS